MAEYLYVWNGLTKKIECFVGEVKCDRQYDEEPLVYWFESESPYGDKFIPLDWNGEDYYEHVDDSDNLVLFEQDDEKAKKIFKEYFEREIINAKKTLIMRQGDLDALLQEMGT